MTGKPNYDELTRKIEALEQRLADLSGVEEGRSRLQSQLLQAQRLEVIGSLVAGIAHEVNNPISTIVMNVPLFERIWRDFRPVLAEYAATHPENKYGGLTYDFLQENLMQLIADMDSSANRVADIIKRLKDFSRQSVYPAEALFSINTAAENASRIAETTFRKSTISLQLNLADSLPMMEGRLQDMEQIILNLILNGSQAIDHDRGVVQITTHSEKDKENLVLSVSDNGRGIDPSITAKVFDPFVTDSRVDGSVGLGLSVTYNLVKEHRGRITFESRKGVGTTFVLTFPHTRRVRTAKILIVDDDELVIEALVRAFGEKPDYRLETARDGTDALIKIGDFHPDLLILDVMMPELNGSRVCRALRENLDFSDIAVIIIAGDVLGAEARDIVHMGYGEVLEKPVDIGELMRRVERVLLET